MDSFIMKSGSAAGEGKQGGGAAEVEKQDFRSAAGIGGICERPFSGSLGNPKLHSSCPPRRRDMMGLCTSFARVFPLPSLLVAASLLSQQI